MPKVTLAPPLLLSEQMKEDLTFKATPIEATPSKLSILLERVPLLAKFISSSLKTGRNIGTIVEIEGYDHKALEVALPDIGYVTTGLGILDAVYPPLIFIGCYFIGEKSPLTLTKAASFTYSGILLGLTIASLAVPFVAPILGLTAASLALSMGLSTLGSTLYTTYQTRKKLKKIDQEIEQETALLNQWYERTCRLEKELALAPDETKRRPIQLELNALRDNFKNQFEQEKSNLQALYDQKFACETHLKQNNTANILKKTLPVILSSVGLAGLVISLFFPPVGLSMVAAAALGAATYTVAQLFPPIIKMIKQAWSKAPPKEEIAQPTPTPEAHDSPEAEDKETLSIENNPSHPSSTTEAMLSLFSNENEATKALRQQLKDCKKLDHIEHILDPLIQQEDLHGIFLFFSHVATHAQSENPHLTQGDLKQFFDNFQQSHAAFTLFGKAIIECEEGKIRLSDQDTNELLRCNPLKDLLKDQNIDLDYFKKQRGLTLEPEASPKESDDHPPELQ